MVIKSVREQKMEDSLRELKKEVKRYRNNDTFVTTFTKYLKKIQRAQQREQLKIYKQKMREVIKEEKKRLKSGD